MRGNQIQRIGIKLNIALKVITIKRALYITHAGEKNDVSEKKT